MNVVPLSSSKLHFLLSQLWSSPVFGTSYPSNIEHTSPRVFQTIEQVYWQCLQTLDHVLALAWPERPISERDTSIRQVVAKSVAFCGAVVANEIAHVEQLRAAATAIALVSWADQTMDRGDADMVMAVELVAGVKKPAPHTQTAAVQHYVAALGWFLREVAIIARPEDGPWILRCLINDTLGREARMRRLSERYQQMAPDHFWDRFAPEVGRLSISNVGFVAVTAMVYAIYRQSHPELPRLMQVLNERTLMNTALRTGCAAIRVLDDIGDQEIDSGSDSRWGVFAINVCNQADPRHRNAFLTAAGISDPSLRNAIHAAWIPGKNAQLIEIWLDYVRDMYSAIPDHLQTHYATFLRLSQRVIEAGLVNSLGDDVLAEEARERAWNA